MPGAFKLDHLQPFESFLSQNIFNFFTFILGGQFLLPQRANNGKREFIHSQNWIRQRGFSDKFVNCSFADGSQFSFPTICRISMNTWPPPVERAAFLLSHFDRPGCATPAFPIHSKTRAYHFPIKRCPSEGDGGGSPHRAVDRRQRVPRGEGALLQVRHPDRRRLESPRGA